MNNKFQAIICQATGAKEAFEKEVIQSLWSGYGQIVRYGLVGSERKNVVVKHVQPPSQKNHPRGWNTNLSHQRKLRSYEVEFAWYRQWAMQCKDDCPIPQCLALESQGSDVFMVLEDLDESGFPVRKQAVTITEIESCLAWLAHFHATFMGQEPKGLWPTGTYWHLETRPDELQVLQDLPLKKVATLIDQKLKESPFQTFVHGDAKLANFCFSKHENKVAAVDFQYVGGGCGIKDVAYFIGSCLGEKDCEKREKTLLDFYFKSLKNSLALKHPTTDSHKIEENWRSLYPYAWTDFHRFIKGWSPGHWKINSYSERLAQNVMEQLKHPSKKRG